MAGNDESQLSEEVSLPLVGTGHAAQRPSQVALLHQRHLELAVGSSGMPLGPWRQATEASRGGLCGQCWDRTLFCLLVTSPSVPAGQLRESVSLDADCARPQCPAVSHVASPVSPVFCIREVAGSLEKAGHFI